MCNVHSVDRFLLSRNIWNTIGRRWCRHSTIEDQSTVGPRKGTQEEPLRSFRGEMWYSSKLIFDWDFFLFVCFCFFGCVVRLVGSQFPDPGHGSESPNPNHFRPPGKPSGLGFWMLDRNLLDLKVKESPCSRVTHLSKRINLCGVFEDW